MPNGPGKYDDLATHVREQAKARGVILIVLHGERGSGFEVQAEHEVQVTIPQLLRRMADQIERAGTS